MPLTVSKSLHSCLLSANYMSYMYEYLAANAYNELTQRLLKKFAEDERQIFGMLRLIYEDTTGTSIMPTLNQPQINVPDFRAGLLACITHEITDIDNYKMLSLKLQGLDLRSTILELLTYKVRHGYGLLVLVTPDEKLVGLSDTTT